VLLPLSTASTIRLLLLLLVLPPSLPHLLYLSRHEVRSTDKSKSCISLSTSLKQPPADPASHSHSQSALYHEWSDQYLDYNGLKRFLKDNSGGGSQGMKRWEQPEEDNFVKKLESELLKCERFQVGKVSRTDLSRLLSELNKYIALTGRRTVDQNHLPRKTSHRSRRILRRIANSTQPSSSTLETYPIR
jgi:hypothetical protein